MAYMRKRAVWNGKREPSYEKRRADAARDSRSYDGVVVAVSSSNIVDFFVASVPDWGEVSHTPPIALLALVAKFIFRSGGGWDRVECFFAPLGRIVHYFSVCFVAVFLVNGIADATLLLCFFSETGGGGSGGGRSSWWFGLCDP